jgi:hypothetical protein
LKITKSNLIKISILFKNKRAGTKAQVIIKRYYEEGLNYMAGKSNKILKIMDKTGTIITMIVVLYTIIMIIYHFLTKQSMQINEFVIISGIGGLLFIEVIIAHNFYLHSDKISTLNFELVEKILKKVSFSCLSLTGILLYLLLLTEYESVVILTLTFILVTFVMASSSYVVGILEGKFNNNGKD